MVGGLVEDLWVSRWLLVDKSVMGISVSRWLLDRWKTCQLLVVGGLSVVGGFGIRRHGWNNLKEPKCFFVRCSKAVSNIDQKNRCMKRVQIRRFFWYIFSGIRTEYGDGSQSVLISNHILSCKFCAIVYLTDFK